MMSDHRPFFPAFAGCWSSLFAGSITGPAKGLLGQLIVEASWRRHPDEIITHLYLFDGRPVHLTTGVKRNENTHVPKMKEKTLGN
ncbi:hypothetical protein V496_02449 [Pseudogymnoascus sp. VKM F-4515 (FW-2607)]|nr:hypothetical protein V496_02449 [Pseudogymnoascus sp. VKM F-4515 (FW-2607)]